MCKVSVIMPSLNVVKYIAKCVDSVINQTLREIEIIFVDAGSTDGTLEILQSYMDKDCRIRLIRSDRKSYGYQINLGLSAARGEYVGIVETDDWIEADAYETLYHCADRFKPDYVRGIAKCFKEVGKDLSYGWLFNMFPKDFYKENDGIIHINPQQQYDILLKDIFLWNGIYNRNFLRGIKLNETAGAAYQDVGFLSQMYYRATKAVYIDKVVYYYRKDNEDCSSYSKNAFRYLTQEYRFVYGHITPDDNIWRLWNDARYFHQIYSRFILMAETGTYWESAIPYIQEMYDYFCGKQEVIAFLGKIQKEGFELFIESPVKLYEFLRENYVKKCIIWEKFLQKLEDKKVILFGAGKRGHFLQFLLTKRNIGQIQGYCDNSFDKIGKTVFGCTVRSLDEWIKASDNFCYVVTARRFSDEIMKQLLNHGVLKNDIILFDLPLDYSVL